MSWISLQPGVLMGTSLAPHQTQMAASSKWFEEQIIFATQRIVKAFNPERIILFGSYAYGKPTSDSDVELLIVMESDQRPVARAASVSKILRPRLIPMDIMVRTPDEIRHRLEIGDYFFQEILEKGRVLYERSLSARVD